MDGTAHQEFWVESERTQPGKLRYTVFNADANPSGYAEIHIHEAGLYPDSMAIGPSALIGLASSDLVAEIASFYPNGRDGYDRYRKHGRGSAVLEHIVKDSINEDAKLIFAFTGRRPMKDFLGNRGFTPYVSPTIGHSVRTFFAGHGLMEYSPDSVLYFRALDKTE